MNLYEALTTEDINLIRNYIEAYGGREDYDATDCYVQSMPNTMAPSAPPPAPPIIPPLALLVKSQLETRKIAQRAQTMSLSPFIMLFVFRLVINE